MALEYFGYLILNNRKAKPQDFDQKILRALYRNVRLADGESVEITVAFGNSFESKYGLQDFNEKSPPLDGNYATFSMATRNSVDKQGIVIPSRGCAIYSAWCSEYANTLEDTTLLKEKIKEETAFDNLYPSLLLSRLNLFKQKDAEPLRSYADNVDKHIVKPLRGAKLGKHGNKFSTAILYLGNHPNSIFISTGRDFPIYFHYLCVKGSHILLWSSNQDLAQDLLYGQIYPEDKIASFLHEVLILEGRSLILNFNFLVKNKYWSWMGYYKSREAPLYVVSSLQRFLNALVKNNDLIDRYRPVSNEALPIETEMVLDEKIESVEHVESLS